MAVREGRFSGRALLLTARVRPVAAGPRVAHDEPPLLVSSSPAAGLAEHPARQPQVRRQPGQLVLGEGISIRGAAAACRPCTAWPGATMRRWMRTGPRDVGQLGDLAGEPVDHRDEDTDQQAVDLRVLLAQLLELAPPDDERSVGLDGLDRRPRTAARLRRACSPKKSPALTAPR